MIKKTVTTPNDELRSQAEARLSQHAKQTVKILSKKNADLERLIHELQVHQIELEIQNEELMEMRKQLERTLDMYVGLYALARVGYFTLTREGKVRTANSMGAKLVSMELTALIGQRFDLFVSLESRLSFRAFISKLFSNNNKAVCEIFIQKDWSTRLPVHIVGASDSNGDGVCYMIVSEISESKP